MEPSLRKPFGIIGIMLFIVVYSLVAAALFEPVNSLHAVVQLPIWLALGVGWALPLRPVLRWMETGRWK